MVDSGKKKILLLALVIAVAIVLLLVSIPLLALLLEEPPPTYDFVFADPALSEDIYADEDYLALDRSFYYMTSEGNYTFKTAIGEQDVTSYNQAVQLLIRLVQAAIAGDETAYNACFSPEYIAKSGLQGAFTMQKIYDICIEKYLVPSDMVVPKNYSDMYAYGLTYRIKDNNGSLRQDVESDATRMQMITVVIDRSGQPWIYGIETLHYRPA